MYKYSLSRQFKVALLFGVILCIMGGFFIIYIYARYLFVEKIGIFDDIYSLTTVLLGFGSAIGGGAGCLYMLLDDPLFGRASFDLNGIYFYTPLKTIRLDFDDCMEIAFTSGNGFGIARRYLYVYMSKVVILSEQKCRLFDKRSKKKSKKGIMPIYQSDYFLLLYEPEIFSELIDCLPSHFKEKLLEEARELGLTCN